MSDNNIPELDERYEEEYKRAMEKLNSSKNSRVKAILDKKKDDKKKQDKNQKDELKKKASESGKFIDKCKADPVIPVCIILAVLVVIGAFLYFALPNMLTNTLGRDMDEFKTQYASTEIYTQLMSSFGFDIATPTYVAGGENSDNKLDYFTTSLTGNSAINVALQGSSRKSDGELTALRIIMQPSSADGYANTMTMIYASFFQVFYPEVSMNDAISIIRECMAAVNGPNPTAFIINGDYAYRFMVISEGENYAFVFDFIPADDVSAE